MPVYQRTFFDLKKRVADLASDLVQAGTATSGSATTLVDTVNLTDATNTRLLGTNVYIGNGAGQSRETRATAFTTGTDTLTIPSGTALDNTSEYMLTRRFTQSNILAAIRDALASLGSYAKAYEDQSLMAGSPLVNATFYDNSGTFPNGWTRTGSGGTFTRESTIRKHGRYSASIVSDGTNAAGIRQDVSPGPYRGKSVKAKAWLFTNTASNRVEFLIDDGIDTTTGLLQLNTANRGWGTAIAETPALTVSDRATRLRVSVNITAGSAVTAYVSGVYITGGPYWREWDLPAGSPTCFQTINAERYEGDEDFGQKGNARELAVAIRESTRRFRLLTGAIPLGGILHVQGRTSWADHATAASDDDTNFDGLWPWITYEAAYRLLLTKPRQEDLPQMDRLKALASELRPPATKLPAGALDLVWP